MFRSVLVRSALKRQLTPAVFLGISAIVSSLLATSGVPAVATSSVPERIQLVNATRAPEVPLADRVSVMAIAFGGSVAICLGANKLLDRGQLQPSTQRSFGTTAFHPANGATFTQASRSLQRKLLRLVHDDHALAERLFTQATLRYAGNSPNWYVEKVIYDLERDRGRF
ncbi:hypothetical protein H6F76_12705 [Leptolyngbya sp. FACHB-321]|uniref:hypothetical protein n=1 Tax=Leptolyngbya sp. FACHB-321 TaxID=2692807 RepID=UPI00168333B6|nr:hypothetical protein [Leptolyngbya sp. FACHB-321]MBD2035878.1 hypothetical protein [Leptolyngbya sp. FACHB-321]